MMDVKRRKPSSLQSNFHNCNPVAVIIKATLSECPGRNGVDRKIANRKINDLKASLTKAVTGKMAYQIGTPS